MRITISANGKRLKSFNRQRHQQDSDPHKIEDRKAHMIRRYYESNS